MAKSIFEQMAAVDAMMQNEEIRASLDGLVEFPKTFKEILRDNAKERAKERTIIPFPANEPMTSIYDTNDTMRIIGHNYLLSFIDAGFVDIVQAHLLAMSKGRIAEISDIGMDFFAWGIITGKRLERERRRGKSSLTAKED